jgi:hypothetical protein
MKKLFALLLLSASSAALLAQTTTGPAKAATPAAPAVTPAFKPVDWKSDPEMTEYAKQAGTLAVQEWVSDFLAKQFPAKRFAVFPLGSDLDDGYFTLQVRNEFASRALGTDYSLYTRQDPEWEAIVQKEMTMGYEREGMMQEDTIARWGRENGVQGAIRGRISGVYLGQGPGSGGIRMADDAKVLQVRVLLQAFEIETGRLLWGAEKTAAVALPDDSLVVPGTKRQWILYGAAGLGGLILLMILHRMFSAANRPR